VEDSIRRHAGDQVPVQTVLNGVNTRSYDPAHHEGTAARAEWGIPVDAPLVGTVAVFRTQKRLDHWLHVAQQVRAEVPKAHFLLVGDGPLRAEVEAGIRERGLEAFVHLAGLQEETRPYFSAFDAYLMTSQFEGLPIALLEAMAMAVPPVVTAVGGIPELVTDGHDGYLHPFGATGRLAESVIRLLRNEAHREALGTAARQTVVEGFSMERMQGELEAIYEQVIAEHRGR
jgi:glycosyltransferase involved in cell wall biosynthesis